MPERPYDHWLWHLFHYGAEFLQAAEVLSRLRRADHLQRGALPYYHEYEELEETSKAVDEAIQAARDDLRTPEDLAATLKPDEMKALRGLWESEVADLASIVYAKYSVTMRDRRRRAHVLQVMRESPDPREDAKKMHAAISIGYTPKAVEKVLKNKKAQGGVYDVDKRLVKPGADTSRWFRHVPPPIPVSPRKKR